MTKGPGLLQVATVLWLASSVAGQACLPGSIQLATNLGRSCGVSGSEACTAVQASNYNYETASNALDGNINTVSITCGCRVDDPCGCITMMDTWPLGVYLTDGPGIYRPNIPGYVFDQQNPWWMVDFGTSRSIKGGKVWNRQTIGSNPDRLDGFDVWVGDNPRLYSDNVKCFTATEKVGQHAYDFTCVGTGRYLFVHQQNRPPNEFLNQPILSIGEIEIYPANPCAPCAAGSYSTGTALTACIQCSGGSYQTGSGMTSPASCSPPVALPVLPSDGPCELRNLTWKVSCLQLLGAMGG